MLPHRPLQSRFARIIISNLLYAVIMLVMAGNTALAANKLPIGCVIQVGANANAELDVNYKRMSEIGDCKELLRYARA